MSKSNFIGQGQYERLPEMAADLVRHKVAVIVATGITAARAAKSARLRPSNRFQYWR